MSDLDYMVQALKSQEQAPPGMLSQMPPQPGADPSQFAPNVINQAQMQQPAPPPGPGVDYQALMAAQQDAQNKLANLTMQMGNTGP